MGNDSSKRAHRVPVGVTIQRVGIDDVGTEKEQKKAPAIITLSSGEELNCENVFGVLQQLRHELAADDDEVTSPKASKKKKKRKAKLDYERCLEFLQLNILDSLKDKELRNGLFKLDLATFEELIQRDDLMVPDESCVLLLVGAWAERRAEEELGPDTVATTSEDNSATSAINLRGSEGLFQSLGKGAAKLLVAQPSTVADQGDKADSQPEPAVSAEPDGAADASAVETVATSDAAKPTSEAAPESSIEAPAEEAAPAEDAGLEVPINLRGTAGLYATLAEAYTTMVLSDEEMARKLQEKEEEDAKALRKLMEEEDEKLARALQEGELADGGSLPVGAPKAEEEEEDEANLEPIPEHKLTPEYIARIQKHMLPLLPHIRFCMLPLSILNTLANEKLVPEHYLTEAYKYLMLSMTNDNDLIDRKNPRYRRRRYLCSVEWDHTWHGQHIQVSADGKKAIKTQSSWYSIACAKDGFQQGKHFWAVKVDGDEAYIGVTQKGNTSLDNYLGGNAQSWAFRTSYRYSTSHGNSHYGVPFGKGDVIGVLLDMDAGSLTFFKNGTNLGVCFTGLPRSEKLYPAVGWRAGNMILVSLDAASVSPSVLM